MSAAAALLVVLAASGCQSVSTVSPVDDQQSQPGRATTDSLTLQVDLPAEVPAAAPVKLRMTLRNTGKQTVEVYLGGRPAHDFVVTTADGTHVWRWLEDRVIQQILEIRPLKPGEQIEVDAEWPARNARGNPVSPGRYLVSGVLNMDPPEKLQTMPREIVLR